MKVWVDPCVDGMDDLDSRRGTPEKPNLWFKFLSQFPNFEMIGDATYQARPAAAEVYAFVRAVMEKCATHKPAAITVPQLPVVYGPARNKINKSLAAATGKWKSSSGYKGRLILPIVFTNQRQVNGKTARNPTVKLAARCYHDAQADGFWVVDCSLTDESGSPTLGSKRFPGVIALHKELNEQIVSKIRIAGPYWGLNLVLWARGLIDYPAIGIGVGYKYMVSGGQLKTPSVRLALPPLRRRVGVRPQLKVWLNGTTAKLSRSHPDYPEFNEIATRYSVISQPASAREQVATFYKRWFDSIAAGPKAGRSMALFQDLSRAYALGKSLSDLDDEGTARQPGAVAESLMLSCL